MAKRKSTTKAQTWIHPHIIKTLVLVFAGVFILLQLVFDIYQLQVRPQQSDNQIASLVIQSIENLNKPAVIEPVSKKVYLPDASLVLPPYPDDFVFQGALYNYSPAYQNFPAVAHVTLAQAQNKGINLIRIAEANAITQWGYDPSKIFDQVPNAQACARGLTIEFGSKPADGKLEFTKTLADGRTMAVFSENHPCEYSLQPLVEYLRDAQSY